MGDVASPVLYGKMVSDDWRLRLSGYWVYRFGGAELVTGDTDEMLSQFFDQLTNRMR